MDGTQSTEMVREDFDRLAALSGEGGRDHNAHYHAFLLKQVLVCLDEALVRSLRSLLLRRKVGLRRVFPNDRRNRTGLVHGAEKPVASEQRHHLERGQNPPASQPFDRLERVFTRTHRPLFLTVFASPPPGCRNADRCP
jgi:hypothetical protein